MSTKARQSAAAKKARRTAKAVKQNLQRAHQKRKPRLKKSEAKKLQRLPIQTQRHDEPANCYELGVVTGRRQPIMFRVKYGTFRGETVTAHPEEHRTATTIPVIMANGRQVLFPASYLEELPA